MTYDDFDTQIQCEEYDGFEPTPDDYADYDEGGAVNDGADDFDDELDLDIDVHLPDDDDILLFDEDGGMTADAYALLSIMDDNGEFAS